MAHTLLWPKKSFFYPIGNTAAVSLVQDLSPEEDAKILLLGCGDPRNILYTTHASEADSAISSRTLDFTCCDIEPAILARNVILFTMLADEKALDRIQMIWNMFYHFYLDQPSLSLLLSQCTKLIDASETLETWSNSRYGQFLHVCTSHTLSELRRHWSLYAQTERFSEKEKRRFKDAFTAGARAKLKSTLGKNTSILTACRSAGPLWLEAIKVVPDLFKRYWETGLISMDPKEVADASCVNPTLAYSMSGEAFPLHYGTDPLLSFHLASALAPVKSASTCTRKSTKSHDLYGIAREQFRQWCTSFKSLLQSPGKIVIRLFTGDAIAFCRALHFRVANQSIHSGIYAAPWSPATIILDGGDYGEGKGLYAPLSFNVIDTSNLTDHVGLLNLLIIAVPLMCPRPSSTLYTEILLPSGKDATNGFMERACAEIPAISLLLGLAPSAYVSNFMSHSNIHDILAYRAQFSSAQYYERIAWKTPFMGDPLAIQADVDRHLSFDAKSLAKLLLSIYLKMFADEDTSRMMQNISQKTINTRSIIHYVRGTFAGFLNIVKDRVQTDWPIVMDALHDFLAEDRKLLVGLNNYQDLCCQLHLLGVHSVGPLLPNQVVIKFDKSQGRFRRWTSVPSVVCVVLSVPRTKVKVLEDTHVDHIGTPVIHCEVRGAHSHGIFSSIHAVFGTVTSTGTKEDPQIILNADPLGWSGVSALTVSFWMPSWILMTEPQTTRIGLAVRSTPATFCLVPKLGLELTLFSADLNDEEHVFLASERPRFSGELNNTAVAPAQTNRCTSTKYNVRPVAVNLDNSCQKVLTLTAHADVVKAEAGTAWSSGAPVTVAQISPCTMRIVCGVFERVLAFPFPVDGSRSKLRIARKSSYVEVTAPISTPGTTDGYNLNNFPVIFQGGASIVWNIHRLKLDRIPALDTRDPHKLDWVTTHVSLMLSDRQRAIRDRQTEYTSTRDVLVDVKDTLHTLLIRISGVQGGKSRAFGLAEPSMGGIYTLIFVTDLRLDLASHTVVADAYVLPLTNKIVEEISSTLAGLQNRGLVQVNTIAKEVEAWKRLLPAFVERCREWKHKDSCEYIVKGVVPLSLELAESPICSCGQGMGVDAFRNVKEWKHLAQYVTRAAISPLFAVSYLDSVATLPENVSEFRTEVPGRCTGCSGPGKPKLLTCSICRAPYCSSVCQREDWKRHKHGCKRMAGESGK